MGILEVTDSSATHADVVILGGGGAGLAAALTAVERGASRVVLLEKRGALGGNTSMSSGMFAVGSPAQRRASIDARADEYYKIAGDFAHWKVNPRLLRAFLDKTGETIKWLEDKGLFFDLHLMYPNQLLVWHQARDIKHGGRGLEVVKLMEEECRKSGVDIRLQAAAREILLDTEGTVVGVAYEQDGRESVLVADSIIIATGGYGGNKDMLRRYSSQYRSNMVCDGLLHNGDGLNMAMDIGADTAGLGLLLLSGPQIPNAMMLYWGDPPEKASQLMGIACEPNTLWVNKRGERFIDENLGYNHYVSSNAIQRQPDNICFVLLDHGIVRRMETDGLYMGLGRLRFEQRSGMTGLEKALEMQTEGWMTVEQADRSLCNGCGICVSSCSLGAIELDTIADDIGEWSACRVGCPAGVDMRRYLYLLKRGQAKEAHELLREFLPLPAITGRVCPHLCESECARADVDEAVNIHSLERFVADTWQAERPTPAATKHRQKVAVVGSGPAGLSCAYFLTRMGYPVTVYEAMPVLGGMLRVGMPDFRLPKAVVESQIDYIRDMGVEFRTGTAVGKDVAFDDLTEEYQAVFFAIGRQASRTIELEGAGLEGVLWGVDFLRDVNLGKEVAVPGEAVVIGGGNVAVDVAMMALRLGAEGVRVACLETGDEIPAFEEELQQAKAQGVVFEEGWGPRRLLGDAGKVNSVELVRCTRVCDAEGRFSPSYDRRATKTLSANVVILAIGQVPDHSLTPAELEVDAAGGVSVDSITLQTSIPGVFAGGDVVGKGDSVVRAIADGKEAAISIDRYLRGEDLSENRGVAPRKVANPPKDGIPKAARIAAASGNEDESLGSFDEIVFTFDEGAAKREVERCMTCGSRAAISYSDDCRLCKACESSCPTKAIYLAPVKKVEPYVKIGDTLEALAAWIGAEPEALKHTVDEYNDACDRGYDPIFAKDRKFMEPLREPPYFAIRAQTDYLDTIGGLKVNERMQVMGKQDEPIRGLYAAGVVAGGWQGDTYNVILSGAASSFAINSGRIAAENAVASTSDPEEDRRE